MAYGRLDVFWPDGTIENYVLETPSVSVGRSAGNTIQLDTDTISRYHFSITYENGSVHITDLDSANGTFVDGVRLKSNEPRLLDDVEEIIIGHLRMLFHPVDDSPTLPMSAIADDTQRVEKTAQDFRIDVQGPEIAVSPGAYTSADVFITNTGTEARRFTVKVTGMPDGWVRVNRPELTVNPGETAEVMLNFKPVRQSESTPGDYPVKVTVGIKDQLRSSLEATMNVRILAFSGFGMALASHKINDYFRLHVHNQGSANLPLTVIGLDRTDRVRVKIAAPQVTLAPGQRLVVQGEVKPRRPVLFGAPREHPFDVVVHSKDPSAFTAALRAYLVEKPLLPTWAGAGLVVLLVVLLVVIVGGLIAVLQPPPPEPNIAVFEVNSTRIAQGDGLRLSWQSTDVARLDVSLNGTPVVINIDPQVSGVTLDTTGLSGKVTVLLAGINGDKLAQASRDVYIYPPMTVSYFNVEPAELVRNVVQPMTLSWNVPGARATRITGLDSFTTMALEPSYGAQMVLTDIVGIPVEAFTVTLIAEDEVGNLLEQTVTVNVTNPECTPAQGDVTLRAGPSAFHQVVGTVPAGVSVVVDAQDQLGQWLRARLPGGVPGWGPRSAFACNSNFNVDALRKELNVPTPQPTLTPTFTPSPTVTHTFTPLPPTPTLRPTQTPRATLTPQVTATRSG